MKYTTGSSWALASLIIGTAFLMASCAHATTTVIPGYYLATQLQTHNFSCTSGDVKFEFYRKPPTSVEFVSASFDDEPVSIPSEFDRLFERINFIENISADCAKHEDSLSVVITAIPDLEGIARLRTYFTIDRKQMKIFDVDCAFNGNPVSTDAETWCSLRR